LRFRQILTNLIGNGIKFSEGGSVHINVDVDAQQPFKIRVEVKDTGIGIAPEKTHLLFKPFNQIEVAQSRKYGGTGLGLVLSRKLAHLLEGNVWLEASTLGEGSVFIFEFKHQEQALNVRLAAEKSHQADGEKRGTDGLLESFSILVADDSLDNQMLIQTVLMQYGAKVETASNGFEAVDTAMRLNFDVVLMDHQMPACDGLEATRLLREKGFVKPIVLITANAMKGEREKAIISGASGYVSKPIDWDHLLETILHFGKEKEERVFSPEWASPEISV
jgi:CheY-like chemotaxis protein